MARLVPETALPGVAAANLTRREMIIGRSRDCDLYLDDPTISRHHAKIRWTDSGYVIDDNGSTHGTLVNGQSIASRRLENNDTIDLGIYRFRFLDSNFDATEAAHLKLLLEVTRLINSSLAVKDVLEHVMDA